MGFVINVGKISSCSGPYMLLFISGETYTFLTRSLFHTQPVCRKKNTLFIAETEKANLEKDKNTDLKQCCRSVDLS